MTLIRSLLVAASISAGTSVAAAAQYLYPYAPSPYPVAPAISPAQAYPPQWSYDPYTSGSGPCPQGIPGDLDRCRDRMPPTYGQPSYWPPR